MAKIRNINPIGHVDVPILGREGEPLGVEGRGCLEPGEVIETSDEIAKRLLEQSDNFEPVKTDPSNKKG